MKARSKSFMKFITVCTGNICRSPMAEGFLLEFFKNRADIKVDSAGIMNYFPDCPPDKRAIKVMKNHGFDISNLRARQIKKEDLIPKENIILAATFAHIETLERIKEKAKGEAEIFLMRENKKLDLPDPYYGDFEDFEKTFEILNTELIAWISEYGK